MLLLLSTLAATAETPFTGEQYRYGNAGIFERIAVDLIAFPASAGGWSAPEWAAAGSVGVSTVGLMWPTDPSPDVRLDRWIRAELDPLPDVWAIEIQAVLWSGMALGGGLTWGAAELYDWPDVAEGMSLMAESVAVSQVYHLTFKLLIGREGPEQGDGLGLVLGPTESFRLFPAGTPSGHAATLMATLGAADAYWKPSWPISVASHTVVIAYIGMHVATHRHFLSDSIWGSAMGYGVARWVVNNRASDAHRERVALRPWASPVGPGLVVQGRF